jgi:hypothetical protein
MPDDYAPDKPRKIQIALDCFRVGLDAIKKQKEREADDLAFQDPGHHWTKEAKTQRAAQTVAGLSLPERPMLSIPTLDQPIQLVLNAERAANLGVQVHALSEDAEDDTAEMLQGLYRAIEVDSRANLARTWGYTRAVLAGRGAYRVNTVYDRLSDHPTDQKIVIQRLLYQESAVFDPFATEPDWSDGERAFVVSWLPWKRYTAKYPKSKLSGYSEDDLLEEATQTPDWLRGDRESRAVLIAEDWRVEIAHRGEPNETRRVFWSIINAVEELEAEQEWNGQYIPLIPVIGRELIPFDDERRWVGMIGPNKDAARLFDYAASSAVEIAALEPKAPFDIDPEEIQGFEPWWQLANVRNFPYLPRHKFAPNGQPFPQIMRIQADTSRLGPSMLLLQQAREFILAGTGAYEPSLGQESTRAKSGRAILSLQQQHEAGNSNWLDNLAEISLTYEAKVVLDLIPRVYDRPGRIERILDLENKKKTVMLNCSFMVNPKGRPQRVQMGADGQPMLPPGCLPDQVKHYDLAKGRYGVTVSIGKGYKSRLEEGNDRLGALIEAKPELFQIIGDVWASFQSWPGHTVVEERIKKLLPPQLQDENAQQNPAMQLQQAQAQMQQMGQQMQEMAKALETEQIKAQASFAAKKLETDARVEMERMRNATQIAIAHINAAAKGQAIDAHAREEAMALGLDIDEADLSRQLDALTQVRQHAHEAQQAQLDREHEMGIAALQPELTNNGGEPDG